MQSRPGWVKLGADPIENKAGKGNNGLFQIYMLEGKAECSAEGRTVQVKAGEMAGLTADGEAERFTGRSARSVRAHIARIMKGKL